MADDMNTFDSVQDDFDSIIDNDCGVSVTYTPVTTTQRGMDSVRTEGTPVTRNVIIYLAGQSYEGLTEGFFTDVDAVAIGKSGESWTRDGKIAFGSYTYLIKNISEYIVTGTGMSIGLKLDLVRI
jgi:hypothetical protein